MSMKNSTKNEIYRFTRCNMPSENNADACRCIDAADDAAARCDFAKAERLLLKAVRLCPLVDVQHLLREVRAKMKEAEGSGGRRAAVYAQSLPNDSGDDDAADKCLQKAETALETGNHEAAERWAARALRLRCQQDVVANLLQRLEEGKRQRVLQPSAAQMEAISRVMAATNDYQRLGVDPQASKGAIKKAYRKLHLLVHPDKNRASGATEAFRIVNAAYERLTK